MKALHSLNQKNETVRWHFKIPSCDLIHSFVVSVYMNKQLDRSINDKHFVRFVLRRTTTDLLGTETTPTDIYEQHLKKEWKT